LASAQRELEDTHFGQLALQPRKFNRRLFTARQSRGIFGGMRKQLSAEYIDDTDNPLNGTQHVFAESECHAFKMDDDLSWTQISMRQVLQP
jgi:hypothetical protein